MNPRRFSQSLRKRGERAEKKRQQLLSDLAEAIRRFDSHLCGELIDEDAGDLLFRLTERKAERQSRKAAGIEERIKHFAPSAVNVRVEQAMARSLNHDNAN
jgi:hypothetical protein